MTTSNHSHPVDAVAVRQASTSVLAPADAQQLAELLALLSDTIRIQILFALVSVDELCVGDLALTAAISMDQSSYALKQLRGAGLVQSRRDGRVIYYRLADRFPHDLLKHCLHQLLTITQKETT